MSFFLQKKKHQIFDFPSIVLVHVPFIFLLKVDYVGILFHCLPWCDSTASPGDTNRPLATRPPRCSKSAVTALNGSIHLRDPERGKFAALKMAGNGRSFEGTPISRWWFQFFFSFTPSTTGFMIQFDERAYFSDGLVKNHQLETMLKRVEVKPTKNWQSQLDLHRRSSQSHEKWVPKFGLRFIYDTDKVSSDRPGEACKLSSSYF